MSPRARTATAVRPGFAKIGAVENFLRGVGRRRLLSATNAAPAVAQRAIAPPRTTSYFAGHARARDLSGSRSGSGPAASVAQATASGFSRKDGRWAIVSRAPTS